MDWFKNHYIDWKQWDRNSDMQDEISSFTSDWIIDWKEEAVLKKIIEYNTVQKSREKLILQKTTREQLENLSFMLDVNSYVKWQIDKIIWINFEQNNIEEHIEYLNLQNYSSLRVEAKSIWKVKIIELQKIIWTWADWVFWRWSFRKYKEYNPNWENESLSDFILYNSWINNWVEYWSNSIESATIQDYRSLKSEARNLWRNKVKHLQKTIWAWVDWNFWPNTFKKYKEYNPNWENETINEFFNYQMSNDTEWSLSNNVEQFEIHEHDTSFIDNKSPLERSFLPGWAHYNEWFRNDSEKTLANKESKEFWWNTDFIEQLDLKENYKEIAYDFISKLKPNEKLAMATPIALVDSSRKEMVYIIFWEIKYIPVLLWKNWTITWWYERWDWKTPKWFVHRFDPSISKIADSINGDASNSKHSKTVKSASLQSTTSQAFWWRYFHWVAEYRIKWRFTWMGTTWCVWVDVDTIRDMYTDVINNWWGYWYVW